MSSIDAAAIRSALNPASTATLAQLDVFAEIDSTNAWLMAQPAPDAGTHRIAIADHQTAGRGRGGKRWLSAPGSSLCLSIAHTFRDRPANLSALTLAVGVAAVRALRGTGVDDVMLKWPNDIVARDGKLGGMLAESHHRSEPGAAVVIGIGVNLELPPQVLADVDAGWAQSPVDLNSVLGRSVSRESLAAAMIDHIVEALPAFEAQGFAAFAEIWRSHDWLLGRAIAVEQSAGTLRGTACGIDSDGALLVRDAASTMRVISGSIRVAGIGGALS
jgi:BirA family biotin operon repressor/biotin-[acetyl-CoA-carboxylase] ligase